MKKFKLFYNILFPFKKIQILLIIIFLIMGYSYFK